LLLPREALRRALRHVPRAVLARPAHVHLVDARERIGPLFHHAPRLFARALDASQVRSVHVGPLRQRRRGVSLRREARLARRHDLQPRAGHLRRRCRAAPRDLRLLGFLELVGWLTAKAPRTPTERQGFIFFSRLTTTEGRTKRSLVFK